MLDKVEGKRVLAFLYEVTCIHACRYSVYLCTDQLMHDFVHG